MEWSAIREAYPDQWLIVEALAAHTTPDGLRVLERVAVLEQCRDGSEALARYRRLHQEYPQREFYFVHTSRQELRIHERQWLGVRRDAATPPLPHNPGTHPAPSRSPH